MTDRWNEKKNLMADGQKEKKVMPYGWNEKKNFMPDGRNEKKNWCQMDEKKKNWCQMDEIKKN